LEFSEYANSPSDRLVGVAVVVLLFILIVLAI